MQTDADVRELARAVSELVEGARRGMARTFDVTRVGLLRLAAESPVRPSDAADALDVNPSTITRTAAALEADGLVSVNPNGSDGRSCRIAATGAGRRMLAEFEEAGVAVFGHVVAEWSSDDLRRFAGYVERLYVDWSQRGPAASRPRRRSGGPRWRTRSEGAPS